MDIRRIFLTIRLLKHWNRLPKETLDSSSLEVFSGQVRWTAAVHGTCLIDPALR